MRFVSLDGYKFIMWEFFYLHLYKWTIFILFSSLMFRGIVQHFGKFAYLLSCWDIDKKTDTTVMAAS